jgi:hypothetical protein
VSCWRPCVGSSAASRSSVDVEVDQLLKLRGGDGVLEAAEGRLTGQGVALGQPPGDELEDRVVPQGVVVVAVLVAGEDAEEALPQHRDQ